MEFSACLANIGIQGPDRFPLQVTQQLQRSFDYCVLLNEAHELQLQEYISKHDIMPLLQHDSVPEQIRAHMEDAEVLRSRDNKFVLFNFNTEAQANEFGIVISVMGMNMEDGHPRKAVPESNGSGKFTIQLNDEEQGELTRVLSTVGPTPKSEETSLLSNLSSMASSVFSGIFGASEPVPKEPMRVALLPQPSAPPPPAPEPSAPPHWLINN